MQKTNKYLISSMMEMGSDEPLSQTEVLAEAMPIRELIEKIKAGAGGDRFAVKVFEFIFIGLVVSKVVLEKTEGENSAVKKRHDELEKIINVITSYIVRIRTTGRVIAAGSELLALDNGMLITCELMETVPRWVYINAHANMVKLEQEAMKNHIAKKPNKKRKRKK